MAEVRDLRPVVAMSGNASLWGGGEMNIKEKFEEWIREPRKPEERCTTFEEECFTAGALAMKAREDSAALRREIFRLRNALCAIHEHWTPACEDHAFAAADMKQMAEDALYGEVEK
jgi:hypothetical protein